MGEIRQNSEFIDDDYVIFEGFLTRRSGERKKEKKSIEELSLSTEESDEFFKHSDDFIKHYFEKHFNHSILTDKETRELLRKFREGGNSKARSLILSHNFRLIAQVARMHARGGIDFYDLVQEGSIGFLKAMDKFDFRDGVKFTTFARWWVRQAINRAIDLRESNVRIPSYLSDKRKVILKSRNILEKKYAREPTIGEIAQDVGCSVDIVKKCLLFGDSSCFSLDEETVDEGGCEIYYYLEDERMLGPIQYFEAKETLLELTTKVCDTFEYVEKIFGSKKSTLFNERYKLKLFVSSEGKFFKRKPLKKIAEGANISTERVRMILVDIWKRIKQTSIKMNEEEFLACFYAINELEKITNIDSGIFEFENFDQIC
ncbi:MAG: sigma-70 family RNA polymerase sigma factor [Patescibacteria group bacterium]